MGQKTGYVKLETHILNTTNNYHHCPKYVFLNNEKTGYLTFQQLICYPSQLKTHWYKKLKGWKDDQHENACCFCKGNQFRSQH